MQMESLIEAVEKYYDRAKSRHEVKTQSMGGASLWAPIYKALHAVEILNSDGRSSICLKQSCPQLSRIGQREHSLRWRRGSSQNACMPMDLAATSTTAGLFVSGQVTNLAPRNFR